MTRQRRICCGDKRYTLKVYDNDAVGVFDEDNRLVLGCLARSLPSADSELSDDWCAVLARELRLGELLV